MKFSSLKYFTLGFIFLLGFSACNNEDEVQVPIALNSDVTATNAFQPTAFTMDAELAIEDLFIDSDKVLVVEIGEGYDFKPGQSFAITLN